MTAMRKLLPLLLLCATALTAKAQPMLAEADSLYKARFARLGEAYAREPENVENLYNMALFYFDNSCPMRNLPVAMTFAVRAERLYSEMLEADRLRDLRQLMDKGIDLASIRQTRKAIAAAAANAVRLRSDMDSREVELYLEVFAQDKEMVSLLRQRRIEIEYGEDLRRATPEAYYHFMETYPVTDGAEQMEQRLGEALAPVISSAPSEAVVDSIQRRYSRSSSVARAAERRRSSLAFAEAARLNTVEAYSAFLQRFPSSDENMVARERLDLLNEQRFASLQSARDYADFAERNAEETLSDDAVGTLRQRILQDHDVEAARIYLARFKDDYAYSDIYNLYYSWHAAEGNSAPIKRFAEAHPDYPAQRAVEEDLDRGRLIDRIDLMEDFLDVRYEVYADNLRQNMDRRIAFVMLQRMLQTKTASRAYKDAAARARQFEICFDNNCNDEYTELMGLLNAPPQRRHLAETLGVQGSDVTHPALNAADGRLYFTVAGRRGGSRICSAAREGKRWGAPVDVQFANAANDGLTLFGFCDGGSRMVLGHGGDIWLAERDGETWRVSDIPPYPVNTDYTETDAYMLPDGSGMLVASDRPGGYNLQASGDYFHGDTALASDIYFVPCHQGVWGDAVNLGASVNSRYCERYPLLSSNLKTLYFTTDSRGLGYGDIYFATRSDVSDWTAWSKPQNLGREVNSGFSEGGMAFGKDEGEMYLSSNRDGRYVCYVADVHHDTTGGNGVRSLDMGLLVGYVNRVRVADMDRQTVVQQIDVGGDAHSVMLDISDLRNYAVLVDAGSYFVPATMVAAGDRRPLGLSGYTIEEMASAAKELPLPAVKFEGTQILTVGKMQMEQLARFLNRAADYDVELVVSVAGMDDEGCYDLSLMRGEALRTCLMNNGVDADHITVSAYGNALVKKGGEPGVGVRIRQR